MLAAFDGDVFELFGFTGGQHEFCSRSGEGFRGQSAEGARCAGDDRDFASHVEKRERVGVASVTGSLPADRG